MTAGSDRVMAWVRALIGNSTLHFLLLGACVFAAFHGGERNRVVSIDPLQLKSSELALTRQLGMGRLPEPLRRDAWRRVIDDEILYREALRLGLHEGDFQVRQRLIHKMLLLAEDAAEAVEPDEALLRSRFLQQQPTSGTGGRFWFNSHFFHHDNRGEAAVALERLKRALDSQVSSDPFPFENSVAGMSNDTLRERYGDDFAAGLAELPIGQWSGPVRSRYGLHIVYLERVTKPDDVPFESRLPFLRQQYLAEQRQHAYKTMMNRLYRDYEVVLSEDVAQEERERFLQLMSQ